MSARHLKKSLLSFFLPLIAYLLKGIVFLLVKTCRVKVHGLHPFLQITNKENAVILLWHNKLVITPFILSIFCPHNVFAALVSMHGDGKILSQVVKLFKNGRIIECNHKQGHLAILESLSKLVHEKISLVMTPDGPRGPFHEIKAGAAKIAIETQLPVFSISWRASRCFKLNTRDNIEIPLPFSKIDFTFSPPLRVQKDLCLSEVKQILKTALLSVEETGFSQV